MKTLARSLLLLLFTGLIPIACCDDVMEYYQVDGIAVTLSVNNHGEEDRVHVKPEHQITLDLHFTGFQYVAENPGFSLVTSAHATTCPKEGRGGFKDPISSITITSNKDYLGRSAGSSLNDFFAPFFHTDDNDEPIEISYTELYEGLNNSPYAPNYARFLMKDKSDTTAQNLSLEVRFSDGARYQESVPELQFR
ncbi:hypothetical protein KFE98_17355 [bacterium SCSIO 12741]|nr:hypothetical protein KFE98_17355 [bacterium SCSIO 12741]